MNIKNYTSGVPAETSMAKIEKLLVEIGASNVNKQYKEKICVGITFLLYDNTVLQTLPFHFAAKTEECFKILWADVKRPRPETKGLLMQQASRTAWKILSDWCEIQCSMILLGQAKPLQMFLPFVYDVKTEQTFYQKIESGEFKNILALGDGTR